MRFRPPEIEKIVRSIVRQIKAAGITLVDEGRVSNLIVSVINQNMEDEKKIEEDALRLLNQHKKAMGPSFDHEKALRMIKEKLAQERKFVL